MIPKQIFFIWLGDNVPKYAYYTKDIFQQVNKEFKINFITYTLKQIEQVFYSKEYKTQIDELLFKSIYIILQAQNNTYYDFLYRIMLDGQKAFYDKDIRFIQLLSDVFRLNIINTFGGIYLDCDTFPIKPFDDKLLKLDYFMVCKHFHMNGTKTAIIRDNYFFGSCGNKLITNNIESFVKDLLQTNDKWWCNIKFLINKKKFFNCSLKYGDYSFSKDFYIEHYCDGNWQLKKGIIRTPLCFLDKLVKAQRNI